MIAVCNACGVMFETSEEDACTPGTTCPKCYIGHSNRGENMTAITEVAETVPALRLWNCLTTPLHWVVEDLDTGELWSVPAFPNGWNKREPYRGHRESLRPVPGAAYVGLGIPLRRPWPAVCKDHTGIN